MSTLGCATSHLPPAGLCAADHNLLSPDFQQFFSPPHSPYSDPYFVRWNNVIEDSIKSLTKVAVNNIYLSLHLESQSILSQIIKSGLSVTPASFLSTCGCNA